MIRTRTATPHADVVSFSARSTTPTIEGVGDGALVAGSGYVRLDPTFAATLDPHVRYHVTVTPDGDSGGV